MQADTTPTITQVVKKRFFNWALGEMPIATADNAVAHMVNIVGGNAGTSVTPNNAMTYAAVFAAVRNISETISVLPFRVYKNNGQYSEPAQDHPINFLISTSPNEQMGKISFIETLLSTALLWGNGYARIYRNELMRPVSFHFIHSYFVKPFIDNKTGKLFYLVKNELTGKVETLNDYDLIHIKSISSNGYNGESMITLHRKTIGLGMAATDFGLNFFDNGANMSGVLETGAALKSGTIERLSTQFDEKYSGTANAHKPLILEQGMKYNRIGIPPNDAQFLETREFQISDIARIFRVPQHKVGKLDKSSYNTLEQQNIEWVQDTLTPWAKKIEEEFNRKCFRSDEQSQYFTRLDFNSILRGDIKTRVEAQFKWFQMGVLNPNDILQLEGLPPRMDDAGNHYYVPLNLNNVSTPQEDEQNK